MKEKDNKINEISLGKEVEDNVTAFGITQEEVNDEVLKNEEISQNKKKEKTSERIHDKNKNIPTNDEINESLIDILKIMSLSLPDGIDEEEKKQIFKKQKDYLDKFEENNQNGSLAKFLEKFLLAQYQIPKKLYIINSQKELTEEMLKDCFPGAFIVTNDVKYLYQYTKEKKIRDICLGDNSNLRHLLEDNKNKKNLVLSKEEFYSCIIEKLDRSSSLPEEIFGNFFENELFKQIYWDEDQKNDAIYSKFVQLFVSNLKKYHNLDSNLLSFHTLLFLFLAPPNYLLDHSILNKENVAKAIDKIIDVRDRFQFLFSLVKKIIIMFPAETKKYKDKLEDWKKDNYYPVSINLRGLNLCGRELSFDITQCSFIGCDFKNCDLSQTIIDSSTEIDFAELTYKQLKQYLKKNETWTIQGKLVESEIQKKYQNITFGEMLDYYKDEIFGLSRLEKQYLKKNNNIDFSQYVVNEEINFEKVFHGSTNTYDKEAFKKEFDRLFSLKLENSIKTIEDMIAATEYYMLVRSYEQKIEKGNFDIWQPVKQVKKLLSFSPEIKISAMKALHRSLKTGNQEYIKNYEKILTEGRSGVLFERSKVFLNIKNKVTKKNKVKKTMEKVIYYKIESYELKEIFKKEKDIDTNLAVLEEKSTKSNDINIGNIDLNEDDGNRKNFTW